MAPKNFNKPSKSEELNRISVFLNVHRLSSFLIGKAYYSVVNEIFVNDKIETLYFLMMIFAFNKFFLLFISCVNN